MTDVDYKPCTAWVTGADVGCGLTGSDVSRLDEYALEASQLLFELSGRQFSGACSQTVRPCRAGCGCWGWGGLDVISGGILSPGAYPEAWGYGLGFMWGGFGWINDFGNPCGCGVLWEIQLAGFPVVSVDEVKIDGATIDPAEYRLDERRWLVRLRPDDTTDSPGWPACQILDLPDTEPGTWSVTYTNGIAPPQPGIAAAKQLACELYKADNGQACSIPTRTTRIQRAGVTVDMLVLNWLKGQNTGLIHLDSFLNAYNPQRLRRPAMVSRFDLPKYGRHVGDA